MEDNFDMPPIDSGKGRTSFVLGLIALITSFFCQIVSFVLAIIGLVKSSEARKRGERYAEAGWVLSLIALVISSIAVALIALLIVFMVIAVATGNFYCIVHEFF